MLAEYLLPQRIRDIRTDLDLTQEEFGEKIGISKASMHNLETGKNEVTARVLFDICRVFSADPSYLLGLGDSKKLILDGLTAEEATELERLIQIMRRKNK